MKDFNAIAAAADQMIRDRLGDAYEVFYFDGAYYTSAPIDEDESESTDCPTCVFTAYASFIDDAEELYSSALGASEEVDKLMVKREEEGWSEIADWIDTL